MKNPPGETTVPSSGLRRRMLVHTLLGTLTGCTFFGPLLASDAPQALAGAWVTEITQNTPSPQLIVFTRKSDSWRGTMTTRFGTMDLNRVLFESGNLSFSQEFALGPNLGGPIRVLGTLRKGELLLKIPTPTGGFFDRVAHRASVSEVAVIQKGILGIQIPQLGDLPDNGLARTPPMGWNSWNHFGSKIDDKTVRGVADTLVSSGLRDVGYIYVNIDDGWQGERDANGALQPNSRFPDMKELADYVHTRGLKLGLYSSPGTRTCAGFEGSFAHEEQDARAFANWGVDYLKYDWCSADYLYSTPAEMQAAYYRMGAALQASGRPIVYSLCQYGLFDVGRWAHQVGGNLWRTTFDILDYWAKMDEVGFSQDGRQADAGPGRWNDPDMLEVGNGGMSYEEYRTHLTLWSMLSAPLLLGNDPRTMTAEIRSLLVNKDVIALDQDALGIQARRLVQPGSVEVWVKPLSDGSVAVALFNRSESPREAGVHWSDVGLIGATNVRDLWRKTDFPAKPEGFRTTLPSHGTVLLQVSSKEPASRTPGVDIASRNTVDVVFIGDSITEGVLLSDPDRQAPPPIAAEWLSKHLPNVEFFQSNQGRAGHTTLDVLPASQTDFLEIEQAATELQVAHPGQLVFSIMLGTNDSAEDGPLGSPVAPRDYSRNLKTIIDRLLADYPDCEVILHYPTWYSPETYNASRYLANGLRRLRSYLPEIDRLIAGYRHARPRQVYKGDTNAFQLIKEHHRNYLVAEAGQNSTFFLHPNAQGAEVIGQLWAEAIARALRDRSQSGH